MPVQINPNHGPTLSSNGASVDSGEAVLKTILPKVLEAVGNGYNHVEGRLNEVQNKRLPSLEAQIRAFEQSAAQVKWTSSQISSLKERLDDVEDKEAVLEILSHKCSGSIEKLEANKSESTCNAASIQSLSAKVEKLQADSAASQEQTRDVARSLKDLPPDGTIDWASISSALDSVKVLSETVEELQQEKDADSRTIQSLSGTVKKLQAERHADADRLQAHSQRLDEMQSQLTNNEYTSKLKMISQDVEKLQADRASDTSRLQTTSENLNKLQSQQAEKANRTSLNVLNEKVARLLAQERDRTTDAEALVKKHNRKLEDRLDQLEKQFRQLSEQARKTGALHSDIAGFNGSITALVKRVDNLESRQNNTIPSHAPDYSLFRRVDKLESRDDSVARVNAESQTLLKRVEKLVGDHSDIARVGANLEALMRRVQSIEDCHLETIVKRVKIMEDRHSPMDKRMDETDHLVHRLETRWQYQDELAAGLNTTAGSLLSRVKMLEGQRDSQLLHNQPATAKLAADLEALGKRVQGLENSGTTSMANIDGMLTRLRVRLENLESQPDLNLLVDKVRTRLDKCERQDENRTGMNAEVANLETRIDALENEMGLGTQASPSADDITHAVIQRLKREGKVIGEHTSTNGYSSSNRTQTAVNHLTRSVSTAASADVILANESIERPPTQRDKQQRGRMDKQPQVHLQKSSRTRSSEQTHQDEQVATSTKSSLKRTFDMSSRDNDADQATAGTRKRSRSEAAKARPSIAKISTGQQKSVPRRQNARARHAASSPVENARSISRRTEAVQTGGVTEEEEEESSSEEESEDEIALRRTSRTVKPTERGFHLTFLDATKKSS